MANKSSLEILVDETRMDFGIPPYVSDAVLLRAAKESVAWFQLLNPGCDFRSDLTYRELLKSRIYYSWNHALNDYVSNYASTILTWQAERVIDREEIADAES